MKLSHDREFLEEGFRWFGPNDPVPLSHIRQAGATSLFHSLHEIPYGEVWPLETIRARQSLIESSGLVWRAVESVPVHEDLKTGQGEVTTLLANYSQTLRNLAEAGIETVIYNFMPVLDWVRTDMNWTLPSGARCLRFDPIHFAAFELYALARPDAKDSYSESEQEAAAVWWQSRDESSRQEFIQSIIDVFPGVKWGLSLDDIRNMLNRYSEIDSAKLRGNLAHFLTAVIPVAEECGIRMAIHPDDPPFSVLGLPRIVSTLDDVAQILAMVDSPANGLCFCSGSFSARSDNDLLKIIELSASRIHAAHLRNTQREEEGGFHESGQLEGTADMAGIVHALLREQDRRQSEGRDDWRILFRPDHGQVMMDDLEKPVGITPGYPAIGRTRGLAEIRGLMHGLRHAEKS
ncbi:mannonate dehydratase [Roseibacillus persicicus]|uniref:mannonate dehydratase n=1 Tax=Roseibacillus persicicus TaxID=454148 RepID=UPI00398B5E72